VAYDVSAESSALIEAGRVERVPRLSRRRRFAAMAVDVSGDIAVSMFARRGVSCVWQDIHVLALREGVWRHLGGGAGTAGQDLLADRPAVLPVFGGRRREAVQGADPGVMAASGSGGVFDGGDGSRWSPRWISYAVLRVNAQVRSVHAAERLLVVPWHGQVAVVWSDPGPLRVVALDERGTLLAEMQLASTH
jgi:hypothetical protein